MIFNSFVFHIHFYFEWQWWRCADGRIWTQNKNELKPEKEEITGKKTVQTRKNPMKLKIKIKRKKSINK